jgi:hypothetical protein
VHVTRHRSIYEPSVIERLWELYRDGFLTNRDESASRTMLYRDEFDREMRSGSTRIWVVWDEERPIAMAAVATDLASNDWVNARFLAKKFPDADNRGAIHYCMFLLVHPDYWGTRAMAMLAKSGFAVEAAEGAVVIFDVAECNQPTDDMGLANVMTRLAGAVADVELVPLEVHRYYGLILNHGVPATAPQELVTAVA